VAMPPISTFRVAKSMKNSTMNRCKSSACPYFQGEEVGGNDQFPASA
jgi:hypothetical protein